MATTGCRTYDESPQNRESAFFKLLKEKELIPDGFISDLLTEAAATPWMYWQYHSSGIGTKRQLCQLCQL
ncbi:MAG: hypothetical protein R2874_09230 [Desulfobacterales bacterium]